MYKIFRFVIILSMKLKYLLPGIILVLAVSSGAVYAMTIPVSNTSHPSATSPAVSSSSHANTASNTNASSHLNSIPNSKANNGSKGLQTACIKIESAVTNRDKKLYELSNNIINRFATVVSRIQAYYNTTLLPKGITVSNYTALSEDVVTTQDTAEGQLNQFNLDSGNFSCSSTSPQTQILAFNTDMKNEITDLNLYKKAVVNLLVAVRSATGSTNSNTLSTTK